MKTQFLSLLFILMISLPLSAQRDPNMTPEERARRQTERLKNDLTLTETQTDSVFVVSLDFAYKMKALRDSGEFDREAFRKLMDNRDLELKKIFSESQFIRYQEIQKERQSQRGNGRPPQGGGDQ